MVELPTLSPGEVALGATALGIGVGVGASAIVSRHRRKHRKRKTHSYKSSRRKARRSKKGRRSPHTAGKRRDTSRRRIRFTSNGQPYVIGKGGKARFISRKSAKLSFKRKGGKY